MQNAVKRLTIPSVWLVAIVAIASVLVGCVGTSSQQVQAIATTTTASTSTTLPPPDCARQLPLTAQVAQVLMVAVPNPAVAADVVALGHIGGIGLKGRQSGDVDEGIDALNQASAIPLFVASDEESGSMQRLNASIGSLPDMGDLIDQGPQKASEALGSYSEKALDLGVNMFFGPVADLISPDQSDRRFSEDPAEVAEFVAAIVEAQETSGVRSVVKHWPGLASANADPNKGSARVDSLSDLQTRDLTPFTAAIEAGASGIMVSHVEIPGLTDEGEPASLSRAALTTELRDKQNFEGLIITEPLGMGAIINEMTQSEAAEAAILAGADIALLSSVDTVDDAHERLMTAVNTGALSQDQLESSVRRILAAKGITGDCTGIVAKVTSNLGRAASDTQDESSDTEDGDADA